MSSVKGGSLRTQRRYPARSASALDKLAGYGMQAIEFSWDRSPNPPHTSFGTSLGPHALHAARQPARRRTRCTTSKPALTSQNAYSHVLGVKGLAVQFGRGQTTVNGQLTEVTGSSVERYRGKQPGSRAT
jgi:hypothetical protein